MHKDYGADDASKTGIYAITNTVNGDSYIGQTLTAFRIRYNCHVSKLRSGKHGNKWLQRAWVKYGPGAFVFKVLEIVPADKATVEAREQHWADHYRQTCKLYNMGAYMAAPRLGERNTAEHNRRTARGLTGRKVSSATRQRMAESQMGHAVTVKARRAISKAVKERSKGNQYRARPFPELRNTQTGAIVSGTNLAQFCRSNGLSAVCMRRVIQGTQAEHRGWVLNEMA